MPMTGQQVYDNFAYARGTGAMETVRDELDAIRRKYEDLADRFVKAGAKVEQGWTGDAANAAQRGVSPLAVEHAGAAAEMNNTVRMLDDQVRAFHKAKNDVVPVPPMPESPPGPLEALGSAGVEWVAGDDALNTYWDKAIAHQKAADHNKTVMEEWNGASSANSYMPTDYGSMQKLDANIEMKDSPGTAKPIGSADTGPGSTGSGYSGPSFSGGGPSSGYGGVSGTVTPPPSGGGDYVAPAASGTGSVPGGGSSGPGTDSGSGGRYDDGSTSAQGAPSTGAGPGSPGWSPNSGNLSGGPGGAGRGGGFGGSAGAGGYGSGGYAAGGYAAGGAGAGSGSASRVSGGRVTGAAPTSGGTTGTGSSYGTGSSGSGSRGMGRPMMGGMGGGRGQGGEDEEHERKYIQDDDSMFELAEDGQPLLDPRTGLPVAPDVIGEPPKKQQ